MNSRYFHTVIKWKRSRNGINGMRDNGQWYEDHEVVKGKVRDFFKNRFSRGDSQQVRIDNADFSRISDVNNGMLVERITKEEIKNVVWAETRRSFSVVSIFNCGRGSSMSGKESGGEGVAKESVNR